MTAGETAIERRRIDVSAQLGSVSALLLRPPDASRLLVLAHGAGAGMEHSFMEGAARAFAAEAIATLRFQFAYTEAGRRRPDPPAALTAVVRAAVEAAADERLPLLAGGKSLGGRMTSTAMARAPLPGVEGLVFLGFPLHPAGQPGTDRADHLRDVAAPMLFLQGTRDRLADLDLLRPICDGLGPRATLHVVDGADHGFHVLKRSGRTDAEVLVELARVAARWSAAATGPAGCP